MKEDVIDEPTRGMRLTGIAAYAPPQTWDNAKVAARLRLARIRHDARLRQERGHGLTADESREFATSDRWVRRFIGFSERRFSADGEGTIDLATRAGRLLLERTNTSPGDVDGILFASVTPSYSYSPPDAALLQHALGIPILQGGVPRQMKAADVSLACSSWVASLMLAYALIRSGMARRIVLVGADRMSSTINWNDRSFATVLGDAGTATLCEAVPAEEDWFAPERFWSWLDGAHADIIKTPVGGSREPLRSARDLEDARNCLAMDGRAVKEVLVPFVGGPGITAALAGTGWSLDQLDLVTLHEANLMLNDSIIAHWKKGGFRGQVLTAGGRFGNTTSASIPLALALNPDALTVGRRFGLFGFGGGLSASMAFGVIRHPLQNAANVD
jgi:3-oxoacyl-[acyl-carrier-protein] synthase III